MIPVNAKRQFDFVTPSNLEDALLALKRHPNATLIAGGTDVIPRWRRGLIQPDLMIDLRFLGLSYIKYEANCIRIGACTTHSQMSTSELLIEHFPALVEACRQIASPPIRNRATIGGNLVNASPAADTAPPLLAYDAELVLVKDGYQRSVPVEKFFIEPGTTVKQPDEINTEIYLPFSQPPTVCKFLKLGNRQAMAIAVASVASRISLDGAGNVTQARIALGSVAPTPIRARKAETIILGEKLSNDLITTAAHVAQEEVLPITDIRASKEYRRRMVEVLVRRVLTAVYSDIKGVMPGE